MGFRVRGNDGWWSVLPVAGLAVVAAATQGGAAAVADLGAGIARFGNTSIRIAALTPVAGPNWSAVEAAVVVAADGTATTLHPQWRDDSVPPQARGQAAASDTIAVSLLGPPAERTPLRIERRPQLRWAWLAGVGVILAASFAAWRNP